MRSRALLSEKQRKAILPYKSNVGELYKTIDWIRDSIIDENRMELNKALTSLRNQLVELETRVNA